MIGNDLVIAADGGPFRGTALALSGRNSFEAGDDSEISDSRRIVMKKVRLGYKNY